MKTQTFPSPLALTSHPLPLRRVHILAAPHAHYGQATPALNGPLHPARVGGGGVKLADPALAVDYRGTQGDDRSGSTGHGPSPHAC